MMVAVMVALLPARVFCEPSEFVWQGGQSAGEGNSRCNTILTPVRDGQ